MLTNLGVLLHDPPLLKSQRTASPASGRQANLADVTHKASEVSNVLLFLGQP